MRVNCGNNGAGHPNFVYSNIWSMWGRGHARSDGRWMEIFAAYRCGSGETRQRYTEAQFFWDSNWAVERYDLIDHDIWHLDNSHSYGITHDHTVFPTTCSGQPAQNSWFYTSDGAFKPLCVYFPSSAPHAVAIDAGMEYSNDSGSIRPEHHTYSEVQYRTAHGGGAWTDASWDVKHIDDPPAGHAGGHMGFGNNSVHACAFPATGNYTCH